MQSSVRMKFSALASGALLLAIGGSCTQPRMNCTTAHGGFAVVYELKSGDPNSPCGGLKGDVVGMQTYFATGGLNGTPKFNDPSAALRTQFGSLTTDPYVYHTNTPDDLRGPINSVGDFTAGVPDAEDLCEIPEFGAASQTFPAIPEVPEVLDDPATPDVDESVPGEPALPPLSFREEWSDAKWLVNPDAQGTQFEADYKVTVDGCTAEYHAIGVYPATPCMSDDDCSGEGISINPDFAIRCALDIQDEYNAPDFPDDPATPEDETENWGLCVLTGPIPAYKAEQ